jgi:PAS domain S-box-containing protein
MPRILIVDDEATITTQLEERLAYMGYEVVGSASCGEKAVQMAGDLAPDIILMDIVMPGKLDGIEAAEIIHSKMDVPIVFLTAHGDERFVERAKQVEAMGYIIKPYQEEGLRAAVEIALFNAMLSRSVKDSEKKWRLFAETINEGVILCNSSGTVFFWNQGAESIFGYTTAEAEGKPLSFIIPERGRDDFNQEVTRVSETGIQLGRWREVVGLRKDFSKFPLEVSLFSYKVKENQILVCLARDISRRKSVEDGFRAAMKEKDRKIDNIRRHLENNMEIIYRLMSLQSDYGQENRPLSAYKEASRSLKEIMRADETLPAGMAATRIDFSGYLYNLSDRLMSAFNADARKFSVLIRAEGIHLRLSTAISCGLIISELLGEALKYCVGTGEPVKIQIDLMEEEGDLLKLNLCDEGAGLPAMVSAAYPVFPGMQVIQDQAAHLNAEVIVRTGEKTTIALTFHEKAG